MGRRLEAEGRALYMDGGKRPSHPTRARGWDAAMREDVDGQLADARFSRAQSGGDL